MYIDIEKIKENPELLEALKSTYGNITQDILGDMIYTFGGDFEVILKCYQRDRYIITLDELLVLEDTDPDLYDDIREVFIHHEDYNYIMSNIDNQ